MRWRLSSCQYRGRFAKSAKFYPPAAGPVPVRICNRWRWQHIRSEHLFAFAGLIPLQQAEPAHVDIISGLSCPFKVSGCLFLFVALDRRPGDVRLVVAGWRGRILSEQPAANMIADGLQPLVADALAVDGCHARCFVPHDKIARYLVFRFVRHGPECVAQGVKTKPLPAVDIEFVEKAYRDLDETLSQNTY